METQEILSGKVCPYCKSKTEYIDSSFVYGKSYGMIYICKPCGAYCGVHKGTDDALGRLANAELRQWKKEAHKYFDPLWRRKMEQGLSKKKARDSAYKWLSEQMGLDIELTHIGMMDIEQCRRVVGLCSELSLVK